MCEVEGINAIMYTDYRMVRPGNTGTRFMTAILDGGKTGVDMGLAIIPGVLIICTLVMMFTNGPSADGTYTGAAYEGIALLPALGDKIDFCSSLCSVSPATRVSRFQSPLWVQRAQLSVWCRSWYRKVQQVETTSQSLLQCVCAGAVI